MAASPEMHVTLYDKARRVLPGGTFGNLSAEVIVARGSGSRVWDQEGREYVDYLLGSGPMIVGHGHPEVLQAVRAQLELGTTFFANSAPGIELAQAIVDAVPCADKVRFASSGSEADAFAMRLARAYTGRDKILKFEGGYHGYSDYGLMSLAPRKHANLPTPIPDSAGIPRSVSGEMLVAPFNDADAVEGLIREHKGEIAAVFMEPMQRLIEPRPGFLEAMRKLTLDNDILLVFDEIVTGFRLAYGGAQELYGVVPDLCTLGKAIGGGFPLAAIAGRDDVMALFDAQRTSAERFVPQIGTLSGNPIAAAAGVATLEVLRRPGTYDRYRAIGERLMNGLSQRLSAAGIAARVVGVPSTFDVVFGDGEVRNYRDTQRGDPAVVARFNAVLREHGILKNASRYYVSTVHDERDVQHTFNAWDEAIAALVAG